MNFHNEADLIHGLVIVFLYSLIVRYAIPHGESACYCKFPIVLLY